MRIEVVDCLQIIASIILLKANRVDSEETHRHLHDAHSRVISIAAVQQHLQSATDTGSIEMTPYLSKPCAALSKSMISDDRPISLEVLGNGGSATCGNTESLGLTVTELVIGDPRHLCGPPTLGWLRSCGQRFCLEGLDHLLMLEFPRRATIHSVWAGT
jgi:chemotaxis protein methyltransferase CheR